MNPTQVSPVPLDRNHKSVEGDQFLSSERETVVVSPSFRWNRTSRKNSFVSGLVSFSSSLALVDGPLPSRIWLVLLVFPFPQICRSQIPSSVGGDVTVETFSSEVLRRGRFLVYSLVQLSTLPVAPEGAVCVVSPLADSDRVDGSCRWSLGRPCSAGSWSTPLSSVRDEIDVSVKSLLRTYTLKRF